MKQGKSKRRENVNRAGHGPIRKGRPTGDEECWAYVDCDEMQCDPANAELLKVEQILRRQDFGDENILDIFNDPTYYVKFDENRLQRFVL